MSQCLAFISRARLQHGPRPAPPTRTSARACTAVPGAAATAQNIENDVEDRHNDHDNCTDDGLENTGDCGDDRIDGRANGGNDGAHCETCCEILKSDSLVTAVERVVTAKIE